MQNVEFTIKGVRPLMFAREPNPFEDAPGTKPEKITRNADAVEVARRHLHVTKFNGNGKLVAGIPAQMLHKALQYATTLALGRSTRRPLSKIVKGRVTIDPMVLVLRPQDWTLDVRRAGTSGRSKGTGAMLYRPRFDVWEADGEVMYDDSDASGLSEEELRALFDMAGYADGLGSYRIGVGGPFGRFIVTKWSAK